MKPRPHGFHSTFRQRQRARNKHFHRVAAVEIARRFGADTDFGVAVINGVEMYYLISRSHFDITRQADPPAALPVDATVYRVTVERMNEHVDLSLVDTALPRDARETLIEITGLRKYLGSIDTLTARAAIADESALFTLWGAIEDALVSRSEFFTLIDIYGHWANRGDTVRIKTTLGFYMEPSRRRRSSSSDSQRTAAPS